MKSLFVMDPLESLHLDGDSTYVVMRACSDRGHPVWWCTPSRLFVRDGRAWARAERVVTVAEAPFFHRGATEEVPLGDLDVVWMRKDPPFDAAYLLSTYVLGVAAREVLVVNDPAGLQRFNEKIWAMHFAHLQPPTLLSCDRQQIVAFVEAQEHGAVLKPWDGNGGRGVVVTRAGDRNLPAILELMTGLGRDFCIAQAYLPGVSEGDKRILLFDGEPVGAILRVAGARDHRANLHVGGRAEPTTLTPTDLRICAELGPHLREHGQVFVGIDVIAGHLTEINVTSPTGLRGVAQLEGRHLEHDLVELVAEKVRARGGR
jgi:glutathione synthase